MNQCFLTPEHLIELSSFVAASAGEADSRLDNPGKGRRNQLFSQTLAQSPSNDDPFISIKPGEIVELQGLPISWIDIFQFHRRIVALGQAQLGARFFNEGRIYRIAGVLHVTDDLVQRLSSPMGKTGLHHIHFIADEISKKNIGRLPGCPHDIPVVKTYCRYMETPYQLGNFGNRTFSPGIDEAYA